MAEVQSERESVVYWCHSCEKRVSVETHLDPSDLVCFECKGGFVESISSAAVLDFDDIRPRFHQIDESDFGSHLIRVLRLVAQAASEEDAPPLLPSASSVEDYLRSELGRRGSYDEDDDDEDERSVEVLGNGEDGDVVEDGIIEGRDRYESEDEEEQTTLVGEDEEVEEIDRRRSEVQLQFRAFAARAASLLEWGEILLGRDGRSSSAYVGNPGDYVDAAGYETLLQNLAEIDGEGRRGPPPAAKAAVEGLESLVVVKEEECAICKELVKAGESGKKLPCGHGYHGQCILPWLESRNSCPVCRFEMPTDDLEYEKDRKKRMAVEGCSRAASSNSSHGCGM